MDDLLCLETVDQVPSSPVGGAASVGSSSHHHEQSFYPVVSRDSSIIEDRRVLRNLLIKESCYLPNSNFLQPGVSQVTPNIRRVLINWIMDLCEHRNCEIQVFFVAVNLLDRFLSTTLIHRNQLQLSACACMLIASKIRQCTYLSVELLAFYTEDSVSHEDIRQWEVLILAKLAWDTCPVTSGDFIEPLLHRIPEISSGDLIRKHIQTYLAIAHCETEYVSVPPSIMTAGALLVTIDGLNLTVPNIENRLAEAINSDPNTICQVKEDIEHFVHNFSMAEQSPQTVSSSNVDPNFLDDDHLAAKSNKLKGQTTPTDITNVEF